MKNKFLLFLVCLVLLFLPPSNTLAKNKMIKSVVVIGFETQDEFISVGTGVFIESKIGKGIITAKHVADYIFQLKRIPKICTLDLKKCKSISVDHISPSSNSISKDWAFYKQDFKFLEVSKTDKRKMKIKNRLSLNFFWNSLISCV